MRAHDYRDPVLRARERRQAIQGMLKHRTGSNECAVLLGLVMSEPLLQERPESLSFAAGQND
jgi:hypothetical protein